MILPKLKIKIKNLIMYGRFKYLGIILDQSLSYNLQINKTIKVTSQKGFEVECVCVCGGGVTPSRHLRPSSGRERSINYQ